MEEGLWDTTGGVEKAKEIPFPLEFGERNTALPMPGIYLQVDIHKLALLVMGSVAVWETDSPTTVHTAVSTERCVNKY